MNSGHYRLHAIAGRYTQEEHRGQDAIREYETALASLPEGCGGGVLYPTSLRVDLVNCIATAATLRMRNELPKPRAPTLPPSTSRAPAAQSFCGFAPQPKSPPVTLLSAESDLTKRFANSRTTSSFFSATEVFSGRRIASDAALQAYREVLALDPDNPAALGSLGFMIARGRGLQRREPYFQKLAQPRSRGTRALSGFGRLVQLEPGICQGAGEL